MSDAGKQYELDPQLRVVAFDLDGCLFTSDQPHEGNLAVLRDAFESPGSFVVIHTSRSYSMFEETRQLLLKNGVPFHALVCEKMRASVYYDDRAVTLIARHEP